MKICDPDLGHVGYPWIPHKIPTFDWQNNLPAHTLDKAHFVISEMCLLGNCIKLNFFFVQIMLLTWPQSEEITQRCPIFTKTKFP